MEEELKRSFEEKGLLPAVVQEAASGRVLMLAYMNEEAWRKTLETGETHFWSRSRQRLWRKGETSGHCQAVQRIYYDCDADTLLVQVIQTGVACHTGQESCFYREILLPPGAGAGAPGDGVPAWAGQQGPPAGAAILEAVYRVIQERKDQKRSDSYVCRLWEKGKDQIQKKVIEEAAEVLMSSAVGDRAGLVYEMADLWFHALVLLGYWEIAPEEIYAELGRRFGKSGIREEKQP